MAMTERRVMKATKQRGGKGKETKNSNVSVTDTHML